MNLFSLLSAPAETTGYYIAGYIIFFLIMGLYLASLFIRTRNLHQEYELLLELEEEA